MHALYAQKYHLKQKENNPIRFLTSAKQKDRKGEKLKYGEKSNK